MAAVECGFVMNPVRAMLLCCMGILLSMEVAGGEREVVLVAASTSPLHNLDSLELRKVYLGFTVKRDGKIVEGLRNITDNSLNSIFLQTVVAMSEKSYENRLLSLNLRQGTPPPAKYDKAEDLLAALSTKPFRVSYMWKDDAVKSSKIKILRVLWHQN
jgi:hypothetical protein